jgi:hypothetical protein
MSTPPNPLPPDWDHVFSPSPWFDPPVQEKLRRRTLLMRLRVLFVLGLMAFSLVTWLFVRKDGAGALFLDPGPGITVRRHLDALNRGDLRAAYDLFSEHYREDVSLRMYHDLVTTHWQMFRTRRADYDRRDDAAGHAVIEARLLSADGERYLARFVLVRTGGRWWIDDLRWASARDDSRRIRI